MSVTVTNANRHWGYSTAMVTRIRKSATRRVYLREWRKARGLEAVALASRLEIERESYYRLEREPHRLNLAELAAIADALGIEPEQLWRLPDSPSLDAIVSGASDDLRATAADIVRRLVGKAS